MKTIAVLCPNQRDATSLYRGVGPFSVLRRQHGSLNLAFLPPSIDWSHLAMVDAIFLQRPNRPEHLAIARMADRMHIPIWVDFDDDLFAVPKWNPTHSLYNTRESMQTVAEICAMSAVVSVSTPALAETLRSLNRNVVVVPNAWNDVLQKHEPEPNDPEGFLVLWRGSKTHRMDLHLAAEACIDAAKEFPKVTWMFLGDAPWFADCMPDYAVRVAPSLDPMEYFQFIKQIQPTLAIVPLDDCVFNRSKSNCAWIEASWAGAATLAPAWPEWAKPGITNYQNKDDFGAKLRCLLRENVQVHAARARTSWEHVEANLSLSKINERRLKIMEGLGL